MPAKFNERKRRTLEYLSSRGWTHPTTYAADLGYFPSKASYSYLLHLHRWGLLYRGHDRRGRIVYRISRRGALWLLRRPARV